MTGGWRCLTPTPVSRDGDWNRGRAIRQADERNYIGDTDLAECSATSALRQAAQAKRQAAVAPR
jgi:hypothetical protein